jgi:heme-binding NEAT domain protein
LKMQFRRWVAMLMAAVVLLSIVQVGAVSATPAVTLADGEYPVKFKYLADNSDNDSYMQNFVVPDSGKLIVKNGFITFQNEFSSYDWFKYLGYLEQGKEKSIPYTYASADDYKKDQFVAKDYTPITNVDGAFGTVAIPIDNLLKKKEVLMHINITSIPNFTYNNWYNAQLQIYTEGLPIVPVGSGGNEEPPAADLAMLNELISVTQSVYDNTSEGLANGNYAPGSKVSLYQAIVSAKAVADNNPAEDAIQAAYVSLFKAAQTYELMLITVTKDKLQLLITDSRAIQQQAKIFGDASGNTAVRSIGEYPANVKNSFLDYIVNAETVLNAELATQDHIDSAIYLLKNNLTNFYSDAIVSLGDVSLTVLDAISPAGIVSTGQTANFGPKATIFKSGSKLYANITIPNSAGVDLSSVYYLQPRNTGLLTFSASQSKFGEVSKSEGPTGSFTGQLIFNGSNTAITSGFVAVYYNLIGSAEQKVAYLNFNDVELAALNAVESSAQALHDQAIEGTQSGQYSTSAKAALAAAIANSKSVSGNAAATKTELTTATAALQNAIDQFKASASRPVYFSALHATNNAYSTMESYFSKPASVFTENGSTYAVFTIKSSSSVAEFKLMQDGDYADSEILSTNEAANERVVKIKLESLTETIAAKVRTVVPAQNYDRTHDIRLIFNNINRAELTQAVADAKELHKNANVGTEPGDYSVESKAALQNAFNSADAIATNTGSTQTQIDEAVLVLKAAVTAFKANVISPVDPTPGTDPGTTPGTGLADGQYSISVRILKYGTDENSVMQDYIIPTAKLQVTGGNKRIHLTLKQDKQITGLMFNGANVSVENRNADKNTRVVSFPVSDLSKVMDGWVKIDWPEMSYNHEYNIQIQFNEASISPLSGGGVPDPDGDEDDDKEEATEPLATSFKDVQGHWAEAAITKALSLGIVAGYEDGKFRPNGVITRSEFAVLISRALKLPASTTASTFNDGNLVPTWAKSHVESAVAAGLVGGYDDQTFRGSNQITRSELAVIIVRAAKLETKEDAALSFADSSAVPAWAKKEVAAAVAAGFIQGKGNNTFDPNANATRAEALTLVMKLLEQK